MRKSPFLGRSIRPPRHTLRTPCQVVRLRDFRLVADRIENVSARGALVSPAEVVLTGEPVLISVRFPGTDDWLDALAVVTRVVHGRRPGEWTRALGLEFEELDGRAERALERQLRHRPAAPPRARTGRRGMCLSKLARLMAPVRFAFAPAISG